MANPIYYSVSALRAQATCSARLYFKKLVREGQIKEDPSLPLVFGSAVHKGIEERLKHDRDPYQVMREYLKEHLFDKFDGDQLDLEKVADRNEDMEMCLDNFERDILPILRDELGDDHPEQYVEVKLQAPWRKGILTGVIDVLPPSNEAIGDFKTGDPPRAGSTLYLYDAQAPMYYKLCSMVGMPTPRVFKYIYLQGIPTQKKQALDEKTNRPAFYKSGKRKGQPKLEWDLQEGLVYSHNVLQDDDKIRRIELDYIIPAAWEYENGLYKKVRSDINCGSCLYRTACPKITLPHNPALEVRNEEVANEIQEAKETAPTSIVSQLDGA